MAGFSSVSVALQYNSGVVHSDCWHYRKARQYVCLMYIYATIDVHCGANYAQQQCRNGLSDVGMLLTYHELDVN